MHKIIHDYAQEEMVTWLLREAGAPLDGQEALVLSTARLRHTARC